MKIENPHNIRSMNTAFAKKINKHLTKLDFAKAITIAETNLQKLPATPFHEVIGKSFISQAPDVAKWVQDFFDRAAKKFKVKCFYFEMNEFDINTDRWYIDAFVYTRDGGLDLEDMEWLCDMQGVSKKIFILEGFNKLQKAFKSSKKKTDAEDWCEQIIIARFMELMHAAHVIATQKKLKWAKCPIYFTEHEYNFIVRSKV